MSVWDKKREERKRESNNIHTHTHTLSNTVLLCPRCGNNKLWKDGFRYNDGFSVQKYMSTNPECQRRFTPKQKFYNISTIISKQHVCVLQKEKTKNMTPETEKTKTVLGEKALSKTQFEIKGKLVEYSFHMQKQNFAPITIKSYNSSLRVLIQRKANLLDPENVKEVLASGCILKKDGTKGKPWSENRKRNVINAYSLFAKLNRLSWIPPKCNIVRKIPFIPTELEIDLMIAGMSQRLATFLQVLKETAMRSGELIRLPWIDVDFERRIITLNHPEKRSLPRQWSNLSSKLWDMLEALPKKHERVFGPSTINSMKGTFVRYRKRMARKLQNPRLLYIHFHTLRHWKATMEYHTTKDPLHVMAFLGHKKSDNTLLYVQLDETLFTNQQDDQWVVKAIHNQTQAIKLGEVGFEPYLIINGVQLVRKRK